MTEHEFRPWSIIWLLLPLIVFIVIISLMYITFIVPDIQFAEHNEFCKEKGYDGMNGLYGYTKIKGTEYVQCYTERITNKQYNITKEWIPYTGK